ncbi:hypothetical protein B0T16DRAFT_406132 [Cercophora newfieldiana]|uniref:Uncharacterized protein n=1 Tax=Cercophora newfieldiana TaxID=92897 RepID=A0AA39YJ24_9PEZI|nr:hypothetical protein B0T16DRAFT_406132 [Cercophora newfieldiana]
MSADREALWKTFRTTALDRVLVNTNEGLIGLAPRYTAVGDQIYSILGCTTPLVLRPGASGLFQLIGESYCHGMMAGEAILGPLPAGMRIVTTYEVGKYYECSFLSEDGKRSEVDPRLESLVSKMKSDEELRDATVESFKAMSGQDKLRILERYQDIKFDRLVLE